MSTINDVKEVIFPGFEDGRGLLVAIESERDIPFDVKRVFYICGGESGAVRGKHANRNSEFCLINVAGSSVVKVVDSSGAPKVFTLNKPNKGLYIPAMTWKEMYDFSVDSVLLALSSEHYNADEYIRDFDEFLN